MSPRSTTRARVLAASEQLNYRPSRFARNFVARQKVHSLGLLTLSLRNPYYTELADNLLAAAGARGWQLIIAVRGSDPREALALLSSQVDVVIGHLSSGTPNGPAHPPMILLEPDDPDTPDFHTVDVDLRGGMHLAVAELRARGARRFAIIDSSHSQLGGGPYVPTPRRRYFEEAVGADAGVGVAAEATISGGAWALGELARERPLPDAVIVFNDIMALGAVQAARSLGIDVPGQLRILGIDGIALGEAVSPRLSSLSLNQRETAERAMDIVEQLAAGGFAHVEPMRRSVSPKMLWRDSA